VRRVLLALLVALGRPRWHGCWTGAMQTSEKAPSRDCLESSWTDRMERLSRAPSAQEEEGALPSHTAGSWDHVTSRLLAVSAALVMAVAALLLSLALSSSIGPSNAAIQKQKEPPYTFFFTHYQLLGNPNNPDGVRYHSSGKPSAKAPNGSKVILSGKGGWNPKSDTAKGGGHYTIKGSSGVVKAKGSWRVTDFESFEQFSGWWGLGPDFEEKGWQGPPGSSSFSGFLTLKVSLENQGEGTLVAWCLMPQVLKRHPHLANPDGHVGDGISLTGGKFDYTNFEENEMSLEGVMFYSTDPGSGGYVLTPKGTTVPRPAPEEDHD
jgi:hypothetical protein